GGQFELESGGQFAPELMVNLHWKLVVNLTGFSTLLWKLFRDGMTQHRGFFLNLSEFRSQPIMVG
ncbi:MAG: hypothetical protein B7Y83_14455, partial [Flavobacteriales bacterium 32-34-25]